MAISGIWIRPNELEDARAATGNTDPTMGTAIALTPDVIRIRQGQVSQDRWRRLRRARLLLGKGHMRLARRAAYALLMVLLLAASGAPAQEAGTPPAEPVKPADVIAHLQTTIDWYHAVLSVLQQPQANSSATTGDRLHQAAVEALQTAFEYARAQAALLHPAAAPAASEALTPGSSAANLQQVDGRLTQRITNLESELRDVETSLAQARAPDRAALASTRDSVNADLALARTMEASVQQILRFANAIQSDGTTPSALTAQIEALERSVPEARHTATASVGGSTASTAATTPSANATASAPAAAPATFDPQNAGIIGLATQLVDIAGERRTVSAVERTTDNLLQSIQQRRAPLSGSVRTLIRSVDASSGNTTAAPPPNDVEKSVVRVQQITAALVPLAEQGVAVENARSLLAEWRNTLDGRAGNVGSYLITRVVTLVVAVILLLVISEVWRRATYRYLHDHHRRRQLLLLRRLVVAAGVVAIIVFGFVSQIGSIATYAGLITAGLAVALQNVILAVVAYFLLIGRYGIHAGDRVTIGGVTGRVIEIGLVRLYMMELTPPDFHPSGRIVVYSNAIIFQPAALFRQVPGVDYAWHTVSLTLAADVDLGHAERLIRSAADAAFEPFRESIERQFATLREHSDIDTAPPRPQVHIKVAQPGIEILVRFPVDQARANELDTAMMSAVRHAVDKAPGIQLAPAGAPTLQMNTPM